MCPCFRHKIREGRNTSKVLSTSRKRQSRLIRLGCHLSLLMLIGSKSNRQMSGRTAGDLATQPCKLGPKVEQSRQWRRDQDKCVRPKVSMVLGLLAIPLRWPRGCPKLLNPSIPGKKRGDYLDTLLFQNVSFILVTSL